MSDHERALAEMRVQSAALARMLFTTIDIRCGLLNVTEREVETVIIGGVLDALVGFMIQRRGHVFAYDILQRRADAVVTERTTTANE